MGSDPIIGEGRVQLRFGAVMIWYRKHWRKKGESYGNKLRSVLEDAAI